MLASNGSQWPPLSVTPLSPTGVYQSSASRLSNSLIDRMNPARFQAQEQTLSAGIRAQISSKASVGLYDQIASALQSAALVFAHGAPTLSGLNAPAPSSPNGQVPPQTLEALGVFAKHLDAALGLLHTATANGAPYTHDQLLQDLQSALNGLFAAGKNGTLQGLGDLGFRSSNGQVSFNTDQLKAAVAAHPDSLSSFLTTFVNQSVTPLLGEGQQAIAEHQALSPLTDSLATQTVHVKAEIFRLQERQDLLLFQQVVFDRLQESAQQQTKVLKKDQALHVAKRDENNAPQPADAKPPEATPPSDKGVASNVGTPPQAPTGLLSFGLSR
jgi:hypothetical protein